jgi:hypothetical protein
MLVSQMAVCLLGHASKLTLLANHERVLGQMHEYPQTGSLTDLSLLLISLGGVRGHGDLYVGGLTYYMLQWLLGGLCR